MLVMPATRDEDCNKQFPLTFLLAPVQLNLVCSFAGLHDKLPSLLSRNALVAGQTNRKYYNYTTRTICKLKGHDMQCCKLLLRSQRTMSSNHIQKYGPQKTHTNFSVCQQCNIFQISHYLCKPISW